MYVARGVERLGLKLEHELNHEVPDLHGFKSVAKKNKTTVAVEIAGYVRATISYSSSSSETSSAVNSTQTKGNTLEGSM